MRKQAEKIAEEIRRYGHILIVSHIDADGISAAAIASVAVRREGMDCDVHFVKQLDTSEVEKIKEKEAEIVWFTDLGSGQVDILSSLHCIITDHHAPHRSLKGKTLFDFAAPLELNPHAYGIDGSQDISGAGVTYLVAKALSQDNLPLSALAIVGAVGDLQDKRHNRLCGLNRSILEDGKRAGVVEWRKDITLFGKETRPLHKMLQYSNDPMLPGLTGSADACIEFIAELGIPQKNGEEWRVWADLSMGEKRSIASALVRRILENGGGHEKAKRLIGEVYTFPQEERKTVLHEAKEYATLLNACGRYGKAEIGYRICLGDRSDALDSARDLLQGHRRNLVDTLQYLAELGIKEMRHIQYFHGGDDVLDSVVGTVASMMLNSGKISRAKPLIGFAYDSNGKVKVSGRATRRLVASGLDLSKAMRAAAEHVGGVGGGHDVASGATIPMGTEEQFLSILDEFIGRQLTAR